MHDNLTCIHAIKRSLKDMENGRRRSWKVMENAHKMVLESHRKPIAVFCMYPACLICGFYQAHFLTHLWCV